MAVLVSSCQSQSVIVSPPTEVPTSTMLPTVTEYPIIVATKTVTSTPLQVQAPGQAALIVSPESCKSSNGQLPSLSNPEITSPTRPVNSSLGGGVVQSKEFTVELLLYCDAAFQPDSTHYYISDIGGLAIYYNWRYDASYESGRIDEYFGIEPDIRWQSGEGPTTSQGHVSQGRSTGIRFAANTFLDFSKPMPLHLVYILQTKSGQLSGAVLSFDTQQISDGLQPSNILVRPLSDTELITIKDVLPTVTP